jgi:DNA-binding XRE family transcriptional regulator
MAASVVNCLPAISSISNRNGDYGGVDKPNIALGKIIAAARQTVRLSQEELADRAAIHRTYVSQIERGLKSPTVAILLRVARALKTTPSKILKQLETDIGLS